MAQFRLNGAQITRIQEALTRYNNNAYLRTKLVTEDLVEDILMEVFPRCTISIPPTPNAQQNAKDS